MQATLETPRAATLSTTTATTKPLWAVVGILSVCALALGASLVHIKQRTAEPVARRLTPLPFAALDRLSDVKRAAPPTAPGK
jgi:hypothetical protein